MRRTEIELLDGDAGWVQAAVRAGDDLVARVYVQFDRDDDGRWQPVAIYQPMPSQDGLRDIPLRRIALAVNASQRISSDLAARLENPVAAPGSAEFYASYSGYVVPHHLPELPTERVYDEAFYGAVAALYKAAVERGMPPRVMIAEAGNVSLDTAGQWVKRARQRHGKLPQTQQGRITA